jgi:hypothetical protein
MRALLLIFGLVGCALVVGATARYGMLTSDSQADGYISAGLFSFVAVAGLSGHAVAVRIWQRSRPWSIVIGVVSFGAMVVSLSNSLGFVALRGSQGQEQAAKANTAIARAQAELDGLLRQRDAVPAFAPATAEQVKAVKEAATTATGVREVECVKRGPFCRQREADEQTAIERHVVAEANLAATLVAADLDNQIKAARAKVMASGTERVENPHGKALASLAALFKLPADAMTASTAQQALLAIMLELVIVACFVAHEVLGQEAREEPARLTRTLDARPEEVSNPRLEANGPLRLGERSAAPKLVASTATPIGIPSKFFRLAVAPSAGARMSIVSLFVAYRAWCRDSGLAAVSAEDFAGAIKVICDKLEIATEADGAEVALVGWRLTQTMHRRSAAPAC